MTIFVDPKLTHLNKKHVSLPPIGVTPLDAAWRAYEAATTDAERNAAMQHIIAARKAEAGHVYKGSL